MLSIFAALFTSASGITLVERVDCAQVDFSLQNVLANVAAPTIFFNTSQVKQWRALNWTVESIASDLPLLNAVYTSHNALFGPVWDAEKPFAALPTVKRKNPHTLENVSTAEFLDGRQSSSSLFRYYVAPIESLGDLIEDILPANDFLLDVTKSQVNVWMGRPPAAALLHFDSYHNLNVQVLGSKRFVLFPPESWEKMRPYPFLHPSHAQSQLEGQPLADLLLEGHDATLGPGDVLYIPPMWWHQVEAKTLSVSVNFWSESEQSQVMAEGLNLVIAEVQRRALTSPAVTLVAARSLVEDFLSVLFPSPVEFLRRLLATRYAKLFEVAELPATATCPPPQRFQWGKLPKQLADLFSKRLESTALREAWAGDLVEQLMFWGLNSKGERVGAFLQHCLFLQKQNEL